jgi:hypothetical protein
MCMLLGFEAMHLPPNVALFALEDNQSSAKALEPTVPARPGVFLPEHWGKPSIPLMPSPVVGGQERPRSCTV